MKAIVKYIVRGRFLKIKYRRDSFLMNSFLADKSKGQIQSHRFLESANIPAMVNDPLFIGAKLTWGFPLALIAVLLCGLFMYRSRWGYSIRMIGINQEFARYSGMNVGKTIVLSQLIGGFLAGAGGGIEMLGRYETFSWNALPGFLFQIPLIQAVRTARRMSSIS